MTDESSDRDRERAFHEWLVTGEIPERRQEQLRGQAVGEAIRETMERIGASRSALDGVPRRLLVTRLVPDGRFFIAPMPTDDDPLALRTDERQFLCSPATWASFKAEAKTVGLGDANLLGGIPVVIEGE